MLQKAFWKTYMVYYYAQFQLLIFTLALHYRSLAQVTVQNVLYLPFSPLLSTIKPVFFWLADSHKQ